MKLYKIKRHKIIAKCIAINNRKFNNNKSFNKLKNINLKNLLNGVDISNIIHRINT